MAHDHRMRPLGANHIPMPRMHKRVVGHMSRLYNISSDDAQSVVDLHKNKADLDFREKNDERLIQKLGTQNPTEAIIDTFYSRRKKDGSQDNTERTPTQDPYGRYI